MFCIKNSLHFADCILSAEYNIPFKYFFLSHLPKGRPHLHFSIEAPCAVASRQQPQFMTASIASLSVLRPISSTARISGVMDLSIICIPICLAQHPAHPSEYPYHSAEYRDSRQRSLNVHPPLPLFVPLPVHSHWKTVGSHPEASLSFRTPAATGINVLQGLPSSYSQGINSSAQPLTSWARRTFKNVIGRILLIPFHPTELFLLCPPDVRPEWSEIPVVFPPHKHRWNND